MSRVHAEVVCVRVVSKPGGLYLLFHICGDLRVRGQPQVLQLREPLEHMR